MGYDYRWVAQPDPTSQHILRRAREAFQAAVAARDAAPGAEHGRFRLAEDGAIVPSGGSTRWQAAQAVVEAADVAARAADVGYFRLNISGATRFAAAMETLGMLRWGTSPTFPQLADYLTDEDLPSGLAPEALYEAWRGGTGKSAATLSAVTRQKLACYAADDEAALAAAPDRNSLWGQKIAGSNDGWVTTPAEIHAALATYDTIAERQPERIGKTLAEAGIEDRAHWEAWISYLRRAGPDGTGFHTF
jgi:hypothetical protein